MRFSYLLLPDMFLPRILALGCTILCLRDGLAGELTATGSAALGRTPLATLSGEVTPSGLGDVRVQCGNETIRVLSNVDFAKLGGSLELQAGTQRIIAMNFVWRTASPASIPDSSTRPDLAAQWDALWTARLARPEWPDAAVAALSATPFQYVVLDPKDGSASPRMYAILEALHQHCASDWAGIEARYAQQVEQSRLYKLEIQKADAERTARRAAGIPAIRLLRVEKGEALQQKLRQIEAQEGVPRATPVASPQESAR
jgi:hypothetical protein